jgi:hypothetical protein
MATFEVEIRRETTVMVEVEADDRAEAAEKFEYPRDEEYEGMVARADFQYPSYEVVGVIERE